MDDSLTPATARERLVAVLREDLIGPDEDSVHASETLSAAPSRWYLTGFAYKNDDRKPSPIPIESCPWCGEKFTKNSFSLVPGPDHPSDLRVICTARKPCAFKGTNPLPIVAVGETGALFGHVERHDKAGFYGPCDPGVGALLAAALDLIVSERERARASSPPPELVWSGPEAGLTASRDVGVVLRELFSGAERSVLVAGFVVYEGRAIFEALAARLDARPGLLARFFLNVARPWGDTSSDAEEFRAKQWPGKRLPEVFYDRRALSPEKGPRASLHAKCVVVDEARALVTSANFTEAAQERNIEAGALVHDATFARSLRSQFESLVNRGVLQRVPGLG